MDSSIGEQNLRKYQEESKKVSKVSVSLIAFLPVLLHLVFFHVGWLLRGFPELLKSTSSGSFTGKSFSSTGRAFPSSV